MINLYDAVRIDVYSIGTARAQKLAAVIERQQNLYNDTALDRSLVQLLITLKSYILDGSTEWESTYQKAINFAIDTIALRDTKSKGEGNDTIKY